MNAAGSNTGSAGTVGFGGEEQATLSVTDYFGMEIQRDFAAIQNTIENARANHEVDEPLLVVGEEALLLAYNTIQRALR